MSAANLFSGQAADGASSIHTLRGGNSWVCHVYGGFDSGLFTLEVVTADGTEVRVPNSTITSDSMFKFELPSGTRVQGRLAGTAGGAATLSAHIDRL